MPFQMTAVGRHLAERSWFQAVVWIAAKKSLISWSSVRAVETEGESLSRLCRRRAGSRADGSVGYFKPPHFAEMQVEFDFSKLGVSLDLVLGLQRLLVLAFLKTHDDVEDAASMCFEPRHGFTL